jgi:rhamnosyltransferase
MITPPSIGVLIPTLNAEHDLERLLPALLYSTSSRDILIVDSCSSDNTVNVANHYGVRSKVIDKTEFNHGATRELGRKLLNTDIVVMMTQDAYPLNDDTIARLVRPISSGASSISYARQLPRAGADIVESFPRKYNYPASSHIRGIEDISRYGIYTFFCSNSCAAYLNSALDTVGGFPTVLSNEDFFVVASLLKNGHKIAYVADAVVEHSHKYTLIQEFHRYFDTGYVHAQYKWTQNIVGKAESRGFKQFRSLMIEIIKRNPILLSYALMLNITKFVAFKVGYCSLHAPAWWCKRLSGQKTYWESSSCVLRP